MRGKHPVVVARVAEPGTATEPDRISASGVEPRDRKESDQASCWSSGPRGFKSHPGRLTQGSKLELRERDLHRTSQFSPLSFRFPRY
jgi:hypothetical protein